MRLRGTHCLYCGRALVGQRAGKLTCRSHEDLIHSDALVLLLLKRTREAQPAKETR